MYPANDRDRTVPNLDMSPARSGIFTPGIARLELNADDLARFNATLARVNRYGGAESAADGFRVR